MCSVMEPRLAVMSCVPCYRHTDDMIKKLESAGLGFYVKATKTQQKLGLFRMRKRFILTACLFLFLLQARFHYVSLSIECWSYPQACVR